MSTPALKHTEGPWTYGVRRDGSIWLSLGDPKKPGAAHYQGDFCGTEADARLICAAPVLLEALTLLRQMLAEWHAYMPHGVSDKESAAMEKARTAIAAAGQQP